MMKEGQFTTPKQATLAITKEIRRETTALDKRWNCTLKGQFAWTFAQFPLFIMMAEVIRRMVGTKDGLLKMGLSAVGLADRSEDSILRGEYSKDVDINPWFDPSLANEGFLWFPDLLVPDPSGVLPFMVSGLMFLNVYHTKNAAGNLQSPSKFSRRLRRVMLTLAVFIGPLTLHVPAGMLLYWASSTTSVMIWNRWLDWRYPVVQGFTPCKRPLLMLPESTIAKGTKTNVKTSRR
jgi:inner membrane protein COX18